VAFCLALTVALGFVELWLEQIPPASLGAGFTGIVIQLGMGLFSFVAYLFLPLSISFAILRYKLWTLISSFAVR